MYITLVKLSLNVLCKRNQIDFNSAKLILDNYIENSRQELIKKHFKKFNHPLSSIVRIGEIDDLIVSVVLNPIYKLYSIKDLINLCIASLNKSIKFRVKIKPGPDYINLCILHRLGKIRFEITFGNSYKSKNKYKSL